MEYYYIEQSDAFFFKYTHALVSLFLLGRIRNKAEVDEAAIDAILSLNIISAKYLKSSLNSSRWAPTEGAESPGDWLVHH